MSTFLISSCVLLAFITAGHSLICEMCSSRNSTECKGEMRTCDSHITTCEHSIAGSNGYGQMNMVFKGCAEVCKDLYFSETVTSGQTTIKRVCCNSDSCNNGKLEFPARENKPNGVLCLSCLHLGSYECDDWETLQCTDSETHCFAFKGQLDLTGNHPVKKASYGCINSEGCDQMRALPGGLLPEVLRMSCTKDFAT
ncbi:phospholipase A2 inhibitor and Ly6/PLAUR domain-containing protein-like isoform X2 [Lissotriton helveticus]